MSIASIIKKTRLERGLTQQELADSTGLSKAYVSEIESGKKVPRVEHLENISEVLNVPLPLMYLSALNLMTLDEKDIPEAIVMDLKPIVRKISEYFDAQEQAYSISKRPRHNYSHL